MDGTTRIPGLAAMRPTALLGWTEEDHPPSEAEVVEGLRGSIDMPAASIERLPHDGPGWSILVRDARTVPWIAWVEPSVHSHETSAPAQIHGSRWIVGLETLLGGSSRPEEWLGRYRQMARLLDERGAGAAMLDPATGRWLAGEELAELRGTDGDPPLDLLWSVRVARRAGSHLAWISTEGLHRCGRVELEMIEVPPDLADAAAATVDALAALVVEGAAVTDGPWRVGPGHEVALRPVRELIEVLDPAATGSLDDRRRAAVGGEPSLEDRLVACDPRPRGAWTEAWIPPLDLLREVASGTVAVFRGRHERDRVRRLALRHREELGRLAAIRVSQGKEPSSRLRVAVEEPEGVAWLEVVEQTGSGVLARSIDLLGGTVAGAPAEIVPWSAVVDWDWTLPEGRFGPADLRALRGVIAGGAR